MSDATKGAKVGSSALLGKPSRGDIHTIHISWAGPERWLYCFGKVWVFEDHRYCGPIVLTGKTREPSDNQPPESSPFWQHVNAWYQQGKRTKEVSGKTWCVYETQMQEARKRGKASRPNSKVQPVPCSMEKSDER